MRLSRQFQACLFFYEKISRAQRHSQANINQENKIKQTRNNKGNNFFRAQSSKRVKVTCFVFWCFLSARNLFVRKINRLKIVLVASFHYTTDVYPYQPAYRASILYAFVFICNHLWDSFWIFFIYDHLWESIFSSLYENKRAYEYHYLKQIFYHQNMIMIFCWFHMFLFSVFFALNSSHFMSEYFLVEQSVFKLIKLSRNIHSFCRIRFFTINIFHGIHLWL